MKLFKFSIMLSFLLSLLKADITSTLSENDIIISNKCFSSVHPCLINSQDCSVSLNYLAHRLAETAAQLLLVLDQNYFSNSGSYSEFPGISTGVLGLRASSIENEWAHPEFARFEYTIGGNYYGWGPKELSLTEYIQATSPIPYHFKKIVTRGKRNSQCYINSFIIKYSLDLVTWLDYNNQEILQANTNLNEPVENILVPFLAKSIRIFCKTFTSRCSTQLEVYISHPVYTRVTPSGTQARAVLGGLNVYVSSFYDIFHESVRINLNFTGNQGASAWCPANFNKDQWAMVSAGKLVKWIKIETQGRDSNYDWITSIRVAYTEDGLNWIFYKEGLVLAANDDRTTIVGIDLEPFIARSIKVYLETWPNWPCMRFDAIYEEI